MTNPSNRRTFLTGLLGVAGAGAIAWALHRKGAGPAAAEASPKSTGPVTIVKFGDDGKRLGTVTTARIVKSDDEWKKQLTALQFDVTRRADTERACSRNLPLRLLRQRAIHVGHQVRIRYGLAEFLGPDREGKRLPKE